MHTAGIVRQRGPFGVLVDPEIAGGFRDRLNALMRQLDYTVIACAIRKDEHLAAVRGGRARPLHALPERTGRAILLRIGGHSGDPAGRHRGRAPRPSSGFCPAGLMVAPARTRHGVPEARVDPGPSRTPPSARRQESRDRRTGTRRPHHLPDWSLRGRQGTSRGLGNRGVEAAAQGQCLPWLRLGRPAQRVRPGPATQFPTSASSIGAVCFGVESFTSH